MTSDLAFVVGGVARSGTTALSQALNFHPNIFCAHEAGYAIAPSGIPSDIIDDLRRRCGHLPANTNQGKSVKAMEEKLAARTLKLIGDKVPDYAIHSKLITERHPRTTQICILRDAIGSARSFDVRAENESDTGWHRGCIGLFAILDLLIIVDGLATSPSDIIVVSYSRLFTGNSDIYANLIETAFQLDVDPEVRGQFSRIILNRKLPSSTAREPSRYVNLLESLQADDLTGEIHRFGLLRSTERTEIFSEYIHAVVPLVENSGRDLLMSLPDSTRRAATEFAVGWVPRRTRALRSRGESSHALANVIERCFL